MDRGRYVDAGRAHEGFAYLGIGVILLLALCFMMIWKLKVKIFTNFRKYWALVLVVLLMAIFSLSNDLRIGTWFQWYLSLPQSLYEFLTTWRSPARFIWPAYYLLILWTIVFIVRHFSNKWSLIILSACLVIQAVDTSAGWMPKRHDLLMRSEIPAVEKRNNEFWNAVASHYQNLIRVAPGKDWSWITSVRYAIAEHLQTNDVYFARESEALHQQKRKQLFQNISSAKFDPRSIYLVNEEHVSLIQLHMDSKKDLLARVDELNFFVPNWSSCDACRTVHNLTLLPSAPIRPRLNEKMRIIKNSSNAGVLLWGWYPLEEWGAWSNGEDAALDLPLPANWDKTRPLLLNFEFDAAVSTSYPTQEVQVGIDGLGSKKFTLTGREKNLIQIVLPSNLNLVNDVKINLRFDNVITPADLGLDPRDNRRIAIGISSYSFMQKIKN